MIKVVFGLAVFLSLFIINTQDTSAALAKFDKYGQLQWNVLGLMDDSSGDILEVKKIANNEKVRKDTSLSLQNENGNITLSLDGEGAKQIDITGYGEEIIEIEEHQAPKKLFIEATESGFAIKQSGITAETSFPLKVNSPQNKISVSTSTGEIFLAILPYEAVEQIVKTNMISSLPADGIINLIEHEEGEVTYLVSGGKNISLFNIFSFDVPVSVEVSAVSGKVVKVNAPLWYSAVDFLL